MSLACEVCPVRDSAACAVLTVEERAALARAGRTKDIKRGDVLFAAGEEGTACATLVSGALKVTTTLRDGSERILALIHPSGFVGEMFQPFAAHDVVALTDSRLCVFARSDMDHALERYPALTKALFRRSQEDLHATQDLLTLGGRHSAGEKLAALLILLARAASDSPCHPAQRFELPLSRQEIGNMLGLTIETVSRRLTAMERDGLILREGSRGIVLTDPARLSILAEGPSD